MYIKNLLLFSYPNEYIDAHRPAMMLYVLISVSQPTCLDRNINEISMTQVEVFRLLKKITLRVQVKLDMWVHKPMPQMFQSEQGIQRWAITHYEEMKSINFSKRELKSIGFKYLGMCGKIGEGPSRSKPTAVTDNPMIIIKVPWLYLLTNQPQKGLEMAELTEVIRNRRPSCIGPNLYWNRESGM